jgi:hypothetical protein
MGGDNCADVNVCGSGWECAARAEAQKYSTNLSVLGINVSWSTVISSIGDGGVCVKKGAVEPEPEPEGECAGIKVSRGSAFETTSACGPRNCSGVCVPFTVKEDGKCSSMVCTVSNDYDNSNATA